MAKQKFAYNKNNAYLCNVIINLKHLRLCLYHVCVVDGNSLTIGLGGYVTPVAIVSVLHVSQVTNVLSVLGGI